MPAAVTFVGRPDTPTGFHAVRGFQRECRAITSESPASDTSSLPANDTSGVGAVLPNDTGVRRTSLPEAIEAQQVVAGGTLSRRGCSRTAVWRSDVITAD
jgi:hypothetical protein